MKIRHFKATNVYNYIDIDISFDKELALLVGVNGSGKTTTLNLIDALVSGKLRTLANIDYKELMLEIYHKGQTYKINAFRTDNSIDLNINGTIHFAYSCLLGNTRKDRLAQIEHEIDYYNTLESEEYEHSFFKKLREFPKTHILSLDRNFSQTVEPRRILRNNFRAYQSRGIYEFNTLENSYLESSYNAATSLIKENYRRIRNKEKKLEDNLRTQFLSTSFQFIKHDAFFNFINLHEGDGVSDITKKAEEFLNRKDEILELLYSLFKEDTESSEHNASDVTKKLNLFFDSLEKTIIELKQNQSTKQLSLRVVLNYGQLIRIEELIKMVNQFNENKKGINKSLDNFLEKINYFFKDSGKKVTIDSIGYPVILSTQPASLNRKIEGLSSGEIHLFAIFSFLAFNEEKEESIVFIDEPELSLHLHWQEYLVQKLRELNNRTQLIFATHSPEIVADFKDFCHPINNTTKK